MRRSARIAVTLVLMAVYAWVTAGVRPFTVTSYVLVAIPSVVFLSAYAWTGGLSRRNGDAGAYFQRQSHDTSLSAVTPWIAVVGAAVVLEVIGLVLGGRSTSVPTLSTTIDHLLAMRWERGVLCLAWLLVGAVPLFRLRRFSTRVR
jgi:hypothetical protein